MKRLLFLALLGAVALAVPLANAQMRGGGMMGGRGPVMSHGPVGGGAGFARGPAVARGPAFGGGPAVVRGPAFAPRGPVGAPRVGSSFVAGRPAGARVVASPRHVFFTTSPFGFNHFHHHHFFISSCFGFPCFNNPFFFGSNFGFGFGSPFWSYPFYGGYGYGGYYPSDYTSAQPQQAVSSDNSSQVELAREVQQLSDQIEELRYEEGRRAEQRQAPPPSSSGTSMTARSPAIATTFVLQDGSHVVAQNYALTGQTLWIFDEHKARKISMSDIDREATEKFNAANGIEIRLP